MTMAGRSKAAINKQSATLVIRAKRGDKFMFEVTKNDVRSMMDKISVID